MNFLLFQTSQKSLDLFIFATLINWQKYPLKLQQQLVELIYKVAFLNVFQN